MPDLGTPPESIGPYRVLAPLGQGGMGVVFAAEHKSSGARVAVKTVRLPQERHLNTIRREIRSLARLRHPGVVRILDEGVTQDGLPWYAMEHLHGTTLRRMRFSAIPRGDHWTDSVFDRATAEKPVDSQRPTELPMKLGETLDIESLQVVLRLCHTLAFVHGEGLVHCDLKPENVFVKLDGTPMLVDFGLMARFGGALLRERLEVDFFVGTAEYMAPEQWEGVPVDARADLYALGCILYELIEGRSPFSGSRKELSRKHLFSEAPALMNPAAPTSLKRMVEALLEKKPQDRPGRAIEVADELATHLDDAPPSPDIPIRPHLFRPSMGASALELSRLIEDKAPGARRHLIVVQSPRGGGKTRIALEAARRARRRGYTLLGGHCEAHDRPLAPFVSVFEAAAELDDKSDGDLLGIHRGPIARFVPRLADERLTPRSQLDLNAQRERLVEATLHAMRVVAADRRLLFLLDDLQWAEELSLTVLRRLCTLEESSATVIACLAPEQDGVLESLRGSKRMQRYLVEPLSPADVTRMASEMLGLTLPKGFAAFLVEHSRGNPFFVGEYLHAGLDGGLLNLDSQGKLQLADTLPALPKTVDGLIRKRLENLEEDALRIAQAAAVLGRRLDAELAVSIAGVQTPYDALQSLFDGRVLEEAGDGQVQFVHDLSREVALELLTDEDRRALHRKAAHCLADHPDVGAAERAYHFAEASERAQAMVQLDAAATEALQAGAYETACDHLERAIALSSQTDGPRVAVAPMEAVRWRRQLAEAHLAAGNLEESQVASEDALQRIHMPVPRGKLGWTARLVKEISRQIAHRILPAGWIADDEQSEMLAEATRATGTLARLAFFRDAPLEIVANTFWSINLAERAGRFEQAARNYAGLGWTFGSAGLSSVADAYFERAQHTGEDQGDLAGLIFACTTEGIFRTGAGHWKKAQSALENAEAWAEEAKDPQGLELTHTLQGHLLYFEGRYEEAVELHERVRASARSRGNRQHEGWSNWCMGRAYLELGQLKEATTALKEALPVALELNDQISQQTVHGLLARALAGQAELDVATHHADKAEELGQGRPQVFIVLHGHEGVAATRLAAFRRNASASNRQAAVKAARRFQAGSRSFAAMKPAAAWATARVQHTLGQSPDATLDKAQRICAQLSLHHGEERTRQLRLELHRASPSALARGSSSKDAP